MEKKLHTYKELLICNKKRKILYISPTYKGKEHDYSLLQKEFPPSQPWFANFVVRLDLGFQGFAELYPCQQLHIPIKRKRTPKGVSNQLTQQQKQHNKQKSKERIYVEHSIGGMKRYRILVNRNRLKSPSVIHQTIGVCAALWNYHLDT